LTSYQQHIVGAVFGAPCICIWVNCVEDLCLTAMFMV